MAENKTTSAPVKEAPKGPTLDFSTVSEKFQKRYQELTDAFLKDTNVANRYDIKLRLEELQYIFNEIIKTK